MTKLEKITYDNMENKKELPKKENIPSVIEKKTKESFLPTKEVIKQFQQERKELSNEKLATISNKEFLRLSPEKRLIHITKNNIASEKVSSGEIKSLEFTFTFDWKFNKELYLKTTAGQVLPNEVREVQSEGITYSRTWLKWEFFAGGGRRLVIHEWTKIDNIKVWTQEEMKKLETELEKKTNEFIENNPWTEIYRYIVSEAFKRDIDPKFAVLAFWEKVKNLPIVSIDRKPLIEDMFTEYDRVKWNLPSVLNNSEDWLKVLLLRQFWWKDWKQKAEKLWISSETIKQFESREYSVTEFLNKAKEISVKIEEKYGIPRQVVLWQALLESWNWQSKLTKLANNAFGHKARPGQASIAMMTWEYRNWNYWKELANFRTFNNLEASFEAYARLLTWASRYRNAFNYKNNPERFLYEIINAWYATLSPDKYVANVKARLKRFWESLA